MVKKAAALEYREGDNKAPRIAASGRGEIAERIIGIAKENGIPIYEEGQTADILCSLPLGIEIPEELYQAVAEVYAMVLTADEEASGINKQKSF